MIVFGPSTITDGVGTDESKPGKVSATMNNVLFISGLINLGVAALLKIQSTANRQKMCTLLDRVDKIWLPSPTGMCDLDTAGTAPLHMRNCSDQVDKVLKFKKTTENYAAACTCNIGLMNTESKFVCLLF